MTNLYHAIAQDVLHVKRRKRTIKARKAPTYFTPVGNDAYTNQNTVNSLYAVIALDSSVKTIMPDI
ncbi:hypothetical protein IMZ48_49465 [Candidatus Bathyarchaeota archaeon]|nr:hypothetical protein [Candidatus Bathyarchaeota archaeon]